MRKEYKKRVIVDIMHLPHINFLKNSLMMLKDKGVDIDIICLDRGRNIAIAKKELSNFNIAKIGKHKGTLFSIVFQANFLRFFAILKYLMKNNYDIGLSVGSFLLGSVLKMQNKTNIQFYDDPENRKNMVLQKLTSDLLYYPSFYKSKGIRNFNSLKEWSYLSPKYFKPNSKCLTEYGLQEKQYIFVREVKYSTNYSAQPFDLIAGISDKFPKDIKVILSLENKSKRNFYPKDWIVLDEPVNHIHSLMYYSALIISSGDSMAREGAMLGVPSLYCGVRDMAANNVMIKYKILYKVDVDNVIDYIAKLKDNEIKIPSQIDFRNKLFDEWDDVNEIIVSKILNE